MSALADAQALLFARVIVATVLLLAGVAKLTENRDRLESAIRAYGISSSRFVASVLPLLEIGLGAALILGFLMPLPALGAVFLFSAFAVSMSINLAQGRAVPCACFGVDERELISWRRVILNLLLATGAWIASGWPSAASWDWPIALEPVGRRLSGSDAVGVVLNAMGLLAVVALIKALVSVASHSRGQGDSGSRTTRSKSLASPASGKLVEHQIVARDP